MSPEGDDFKPSEPYTHRLRRILDEYPDGSQVLREILQNSDDARSTEQIFILDHNTYPSDSLFNPEFHRFQGPALLAKNSEIFKERDFDSLLKLADSEKRDQFDKIGVMGVGFNSIYHLTDSPSFITGGKYVILDPHEWYYNGGKKFSFIEKNLAEGYPDQFAPFKIPSNEPCDKPFKKPFDGTIFRYPLRNSKKSDISEKIYTPEEISIMFRNFYEKESINCLLFLKYIERICFYELKKGAKKLELLYTIQLENADEVRQQRRLVNENIIPMMDLLRLKNFSSKNNLETSSYVASFSRQQKNYPKEINSWLILNYLNDLLETETYFQKQYGKNIREYKFIPNVGLAAPLNNSNSTGRLFCFLPLPIDMPFSVSVHGYFAVSTNRRSLWSAADNEDLADDASARLKVKWNSYLFDKVLPKAWAKFLRELPFKVSIDQSNDIHNFWPIAKKDKKETSGNINIFCKDLLPNTIENLDMKDHVFEGPPSSITIGAVSEVSANSYNMAPFQESEFYWLSLYNGYLGDHTFDLPVIVRSIGFPVISTSYSIVKALKESTRHKRSLKFISPTIIRTYLKSNYAKWRDGAIGKEKVLKLFEYILQDKNFSALEGFNMIPLANGNLGTLTRSRNPYVYIDPDNNNDDYINNERHIFTNQLNKFIDHSIDSGLYDLLYKNAKAGWNLNIKILNESAVADMIRFSLGYTRHTNNFEEISMPNDHEWIYRLWDNLNYRDWDLGNFEDIHLIPTSRSTLRKLKTPRKIFSSIISNNVSIKPLIPILEKFGAVFVDNKFDYRKFSEWYKITPYIIKLDDIISVLNSFLADPSYPRNLNYQLRTDEISVLVNYLSIYLRQNQHHLMPRHIEVLKYFPIFTKLDHSSPISLLSGNNRNWYLLPREENYGKIIYPSHMGGFLNTSSQDLCYILENIIKIPRLSIYDYWKQYVIPFLESQTQKDIDIVINKLFDRLSHLHSLDANLIVVLGKKSFVPAGTLKMSQRQQMPHNARLVKRPIELFDPEEKFTDLFFEDEQVFPAGKYGIPQGSFFSTNFLSNLRTLGIKKVLSPNDIIFRIDTIMARRQTSSINDLIHTKALKLLKYIDENWDRLNNNNVFLGEAILKKDWIPTVDESGRKFFSKPEECYYKEYKYLVCSVAPVLDYSPKNINFLNYLNWHVYPDVEVVLGQLKFCRDCVTRKQPPNELESICNAIYKYMYEAFQNDKSSFDYMKSTLENESWILCDGTFHPSDKVIVKLSDEFLGNDSLVVRLPLIYTIKFENLFEAMGVRDQIGVKDLILIIKNKRNENKDLSIDETKNVIQILEQIIKIQKEEKNPEGLNGLLIPSTNNVLVDLQEIHFDDMGDRLDNEKKSKYKIAHPLIRLHIAEALNMQTLAGKICDTDWEPYEQNESLTTSIKNIIQDYSSNQLIKEFLQNADDANAKHFSVILDRRQHDDSKKSLLSKEMENWQGPAIWIYNDATFSEDDFQALIKLGIGGKSRDNNENDTRIGKFGKGFNCAFHVTDLPSFVSGEYIAFLDPHAKFLPANGYPPKRLKGIRKNFIESEFKKSFPDQCHPYETIGYDFNIDFTKEFNGTLVRLPLRTRKLANQSKISNKFFEINEILGLFELFNSKEMLFLRNIESCSIYDMKDQNPPQLIWQAKINNNKSCQNFRQKVIDSIDDAQIYQLDIEIIDNTQKGSEIWAICTGGHDRIKSEFNELKEFSKEKRLKPRGGVASLLSRSDKKSLDGLKAESFPNPPEIRGEIFSYLSLSMKSQLGVHLNGNFSLISARLQSENDFLKSNCDDAKWNRYILLEVLPDLHTKLLEYIVELEKARHMKESSNFISHITNNLWPISKYDSTMDLFKTYGLNVIRRLGHNREKKFFWTEANGGQFVSLQIARILEKEQLNIANILINLKVPIQVVKLDKEKMEQLNEIVKSEEPPNFPYTSISGKLVCEELQLMRPFKDYITRNDNTHDSLFQLLNFILQDKDSFESLTKLPLVPLSDGSVGEFGKFGEQKVYYIGKQKHLELFPIAGPSKFISLRLPKDLLEIFSGDEFSKVTNIQKFDVSAILALLKDELPNVNILPWNPNSRSIPNKNWLEKIWSMLNKSEDIEFTNLSELPLLPVIKPSDILIQPDIANPILYIPENGPHSLFSVLVKLKVRFTHMIFPESTHDDLKKCVVPCTSINIINSLEKALLYTNMKDMKQLFKNSELSSSDYENFRTFIKVELDTLIEHGQNQENFLNILISLPIWPIHSCEDNFIDARSGSLLPYSLPFFSFRKNTKFYKCDHESDFNTLIKLGVNFISELDYVKNHILPDFIRFSTPPQNYIPFLQNVLSLNNPEIEKYFKQHAVIPNKSLTEFVSANTLYDTNNSLFRSIFADTDKVLPPELQNNPVCLEALGRIGLKRQVNCNTYIECALEIAFQIRQETFPRNVIKNRARDLVRYLYEHTDTLDFNNEQWNRIKRIEFVPSEKNIQSQFYQKPKEASWFESFEKLCSHKYKEICWTQCPLFDENVEPTTSFNERYQEIGFPPTEHIIEHWFVIEKMAKEGCWNRSQMKELKKVITEIYEVMDKISELEDQKMLIKLKTKKPNKKIFLNGEDPFDEKNWVAGKDLVFGIQEDIEEMYKVNDYLKEYKDLLMLAGASEIDPPPPPTPDPIFDQKNKLVKTLLDKFERQSNEYHDVTFIVGEEKICANRYVLSAASTYFEKMFFGGLSESARNKIEIKINDIQPNIFRVLVRWLYGQSFEDAMNSVLCKRDDFTTEQESYESYYLLHLVKLLKVTDFYGVELKSKVEDTIIQYIAVNNVCDVLAWSKESKATRLKDYCKEYIKSNKELVTKLHEDANERLKISRF